MQGFRTFHAVYGTDLWRFRANESTGKCELCPARKFRERLERWLDLVRALWPSCPDRISSAGDHRARTPVAVCANEGLWTAEDAYRQIINRTADVYCFSPYWVGSLLQFQRISCLAAFEHFRVCKHTHGEFGIAAAAAHQVLLTLPSIVVGNQQTAQMMQDVVLTAAMPIAGSPKWGVPSGAGLGIQIDEQKVGIYSEYYRERGQFLPNDPRQCPVEMHIGA